MSQPVIQTENLTKVFGRGRKQKIAVRTMNLSVAPRQVYGFLGQNGAGKSTTIRMLLTLMRPTKGRALLLGHNPRNNPAILRRVGWLVEGAAFYPYLSGWQNLEVVGNSHGGFDGKRAHELLELVGLAEAKQVKFRKYSTGMKQRLGIAASLLHDPEVLIFDEPTNGMDPSGIREMRQFIRELAHTHGKTVFLTSHLLGEVQQACDRVAIIHHGQMIQEGSITDLLNQRPQIEAEVSSVDSACDVLKESWTVNITEQNHLMIDAQRDDAPEIVRKLVENQIDIFSIKPYQQTLEDYFINLTNAQGDSAS